MERTKNESQQSTTMQTRNFSRSGSLITMGQTTDYGLVSNADYSNEHIYVAEKTRVKRRLWNQIHDFKVEEGLSSHEHIRVQVRSSKVVVEKGKHHHNNCTRSERQGKGQRKIEERFGGFITQRKKKLERRKIKARKWRQFQKRTKRFNSNNSTTTESSCCTEKTARLQNCGGHATFQGPVDDRFNNPCPQSSQQYSEQRIHIIRPIIFHSIGGWSVVHHPNSRTLNILTTKFRTSGYFAAESNSSTTPDYSEYNSSHNTSSTWKSSHER